MIVSSIVRRRSATPVTQAGAQPPNGDGVTVLAYRAAARGNADTAWLTSSRDVVSQGDVLRRGLPRGHASSAVH